MSDTIRTVGVVPFVMVPVHIVRNPDVSFGARCLYSVLASYSSSDRTEVFPSNKTLSCQLGCDVRTIQRLKIELQEKGLLTVGRRFDEGRETTCLYHLQAGATRDTGVMGEGDMAVIPGVTPVSYHELDTVDLEFPSGEGNEVSAGAKKPKEKFPLSSVWSRLPQSHQVVMLKDALEKFDKYRRERKEGLYVLSTIEAKAKEIASHPWAITVSAIERTIANGWTGVFIEDEAKRGTTSKNSAPSKPAPKECPEW